MFKLTKVAKKQTENIIKILFLTGLRLGKNTCLSRRPRRREPKSGADA